MRNILAILELESRLSDLSETHCVAGTAMTLVPVFSGEVNAFHISPVKVLRESTVGDTVCGRILSLEFLSLLVSLCEVVLLTKNLSLCLSGGLGQADVVTVASILDVVLLILAGICLPAEIRAIDGVNQEIILV